MSVIHWMWVICCRVEHQIVIAQGASGTVWRGIMVHEPEVHLAIKRIWCHNLN